MKKIIYSMFAFAMLLGTASCSSDDDNSSSDPGAQVTATVTSGNWRITNFNDSGTDETSHFTGYNFTFGSSGVLNASNNVNNYTGVWTVTEDDSDDSIDDLDFNIGFIDPIDFIDLTEDWQILERTSTKLRLQHVSGGNGGTDLLTFEKN